VVSEEKIFFRIWPTRNKNWLWQPCLLTDREEMSNLYRGPRCFLPCFGSLGQAISEKKIQIWKVNMTDVKWFSARWTKKRQKLPVHSIYLVIDDHDMRHVQWTIITDHIFTSHFPNLIKFLTKEISSIRKTKEYLPQHVYKIKQLISMSTDT
jgi:hypothetical protein